MIFVLKLVFFARKYWTCIIYKCDFILLYNTIYIHRNKNLDALNGSKI